MKRLLPIVALLIVIGCGADAKFQIKEPGITVDVEVISGSVEEAKAVLQAAVDSVK